MALDSLSTRCTAAESLLRRLPVALGLVLALTVLFTVMATPATGEESVAGVGDDLCADGAMPQADLADVATGSVHTAAINCLLWRDFLERSGWHETGHRR